MVRLALVSILISLSLLLVPTFGFAEEPGDIFEEAAKLHVHPISVAPFAILLLSIALLPLFATHFWESNLRKLIVAMGISTPVLIYLFTLEHGTHALVDSLIEYAQFIILLGSLYTVSGGIVLEGDLQPSAKVNTGLLLVGTALANIIGTTGASMLLIRPFLKINSRRQRRMHLPVFFIFLVSNLGGLLTPLGDPPLFLGFLRGVDFFWTLRLWPLWLMAVGIVSAVFFVWDTIALRGELGVGLPSKTDPSHAIVTESSPQVQAQLAEMEAVPGHGRLRLAGAHNFLFLAGILVVVLLHSEQISAKVGLKQLEFPLGTLLLAGLSLLAYLTTSHRLRVKNGFAWGAILEVAALFIGIFITMVPALALLEADGSMLGVKEPWQYFWATGALSSFLDNAPTYVSFATLAAGGRNFAPLMTEQPLILMAISAGAVFMGANTYIGNGPNFMVKAIADEAGYPTPSFFGYMLYSGAILLPTFVLITVVFFL